MTRNVSLRVESSLIRLDSSRSYGFRPASTRSTTTMSLATRSQSTWNRRAAGLRKTNRATLCPQLGSEYISL